MSDYDRYDQPRSRTTIAIVVAVVLLAVLGGSVGYILATANRDGKDTGGGAASPTPTTGPTSASPTGTKKGTSPATSTTTRKTYPPTGPGDCPQQTVEAAGVSLVLVKFLKTARSEIWICKDQQNKLYYQGHIRSRDFTAATSDNSLFLRNVTVENDVYRATNNNFVYLVSTDGLRIEKDGKLDTEEPAVR